MARDLDLELLRSMFSDNKSHVAVGKVKQLELATDRSVLLALCEILTQDREVVAKVTFDAIGPNAGSIQFPQPDDLVLLEFADGDPNQAFLTKRLSSKTDVIPSQASSGDMVHRALEGKNLWLLAKHIYLGQGSDTPTEPLVLGNVMKSCIEDLIKAFTDPSQVGITPLGPAVLDPAVRTALTQVKSKYVTDDSTNIVSKFGFTERGTS